jgi:hypothetical protein
MRIVLVTEAGETYSEISPHTLCQGGSTTLTISTDKIWKTNITDIWKE